MMIPIDDEINEKVKKNGAANPLEGRDLKFDFIVPNPEPECSMKEVKDTPMEEIGQPEEEDRFHLDTGATEEEEEDLI